MIDKLLEFIMPLYVVNVLSINAVSQRAIKEEDDWLDTWSLNDNSLPWSVFHSERIAHVPKKTKIGILPCLEPQPNSYKLMAHCAKITR